MFVHGCRQHKQPVSVSADLRWWYIKDQAARKTEAAVFFFFFSPLSQQNDEWTLKDVNRYSRFHVYEKHLNGGFPFYFRPTLIMSAHHVDGGLVKFAHHYYHVQILQKQP